jgi:hypothetical protein
MQLEMECQKVYYFSLSDIVSSELTYFMALVLTPLAMIDYSSIWQHQSTRYNTVELQWDNSNVNDDLAGRTRGKNIDRQCRQLCTSKEGHQRE